MILYNFQVCERYHHTRTKALYKTMCKRIRSRGENFFLISGTEQHDHIPLLKLTEKDDYISAIDKTLNCFLYHNLNQTKFDYFFFGDDDTFINFNNLDQFVSTLNKSDLAIYGNIQRMYRFKPYNEDVHLTGGPGILMNRKTFELTARIIDRYYIRDTDFSDVSLALNIIKHNKENPDKINLINSLGFFQDHHWRNEASPLTEKDYPYVITYHLRSWLKGKKSYNEIYSVYNKLSAFDR